tara:strand:+ start:695 stop:808 length:114 start_codon:yes stop_codon:yes gene_type:complete
MKRLLLLLPLLVAAPVSDHLTGFEQDKKGLGTGMTTY